MGSRIPRPKKSRQVKVMGRSFITNITTEKLIAQNSCREIHFLSKGVPVEGGKPILGPVSKGTSVAMIKDGPTTQRTGRNTFVLSETKLGGRDEEVVNENEWPDIGDLTSMLK